MAVGKDANAAVGDLPVSVKMPNTGSNSGSKINWMVNGVTQTQQLTQNQRKRNQSR